MRLRWLALRASSDSWTTFEDPARGTIKVKKGLESSSCTTDNVLETTRVKCLKRWWSFESRCSNGGCRDILSNGRGDWDCVSAETSEYVILPLSSDRGQDMVSFCGLSGLMGTGK